MLKILIITKKDNPSHGRLCTICGIKYYFYGSAEPITECQYCDGKNPATRKLFTGMTTRSLKSKKVNRNPRIIKRN